MSAVRTGCVVVKVKTGRSARALLKYKNKIKFDEKGEREKYLFEAARNCSSNTSAAIIEWELTRREHNTDKATRKAKARFEQVDPATGLHETGLEAMHVRYKDPNGKTRTRLAKKGETPTHARIEPSEQRVRSGEAVHSIYAFGADMVNPKDAQACQRAFEAVVAEREQNYKGLQEHIWAERNGDSGLLHVHVASNATIARGFTAPDGKRYRAGQRMAGALVHVHSTRDRFDGFMDQNPEYGFKQALARVGSAEYTQAQRRSSQKDYWDHRRDNESNHDALRRLTHNALASPDVTDRTSYLRELKREGVEVSLTPERDDYFYKLPGMRSRVRGTNLKTDHASRAQVGDQLDGKSNGRKLVALRQRQSIGKPAPLASATNGELAALRPEVAAQASQETKRHVAGQQQLAERWDLHALVEDARVKALEDISTLPESNWDGDGLEKLFAQHLASNPDARALMQTDTRGRTVYSVHDRSHDRWVAIDAAHAGAGLSRENVMAPLQERASEISAATSEQKLAALFASLDANLERERKLSNQERIEAGLPAKHDEPASAALQDEIPVAPEPWKSGLRAVEGNRTERTQQILDAVARFEEEHAVEALTRGERLDESQIPQGVGAGFLKKYGDALDPTVRQQLELRDAKKQARSDAYEAGSLGTKERERLQQQGDFGKSHEGHYDELWGAIQQSNTTKQRLEEELREGVYEMDTPRAREDQRAHAAWETKAERMRDQDRQLGTDRSGESAQEASSSKPAPSQGSESAEMLQRVMDISHADNAEAKTEPAEPKLTPMQRKIRERNKKSAAANKRREQEQSQNQSNGMSFGD